jgi:hypothetical protein
MFSSTVDEQRNEVHKFQEGSGDIIQMNIQRDGRAVEASKQRVGLRLDPPVETYVMCDEKEAVGRLIRAYRSVAEREISIGDNVVLCIIRRKAQEQRDQKNVCFQMEVIRSKLKHH